MTGLKMQLFGFTFVAAGLIGHATGGSAWEIIAPLGIILMFVGIFI